MKRVAFSLASAPKTQPRINTRTDVEETEADNEDDYVTVKRSEWKIANEGRASIITTWCGFRTMTIYIWQQSTPNATT